MTAAPTGDVEIVDDRHEVVIRRIPVGTLDTNCYAVHGHGSRRAVLIDPDGEPQRILNACSDLTVDLIVLTHTHWDLIVLTHTHWDLVEGLAEVHGALGAPVAAHFAGPWHSVDDVELATLNWVRWFNETRLHGEIGHIPPLEHEANHYRHNNPQPQPLLGEPSLH